MRSHQPLLFVGTALVALAAAACGGGGPGTVTTSPASPTVVTAGDDDVAAQTGVRTAAASRPPSITLGAEEQLLTIGQYGLMNVPDEHLAMRLEKDGSYHAWLTGEVNKSEGSVALMTTTDLQTFSPLVQSGGNATPVFGPSGPGSSAFDADYAGPGAIVRVRGDDNLLMIYHGENHSFDGTTYAVSPFYATVGLATSSDHGRTWTRQGAIIAGADPKPTVAPTDAGFGALIPTAIVAHGYIYVYYTDYVVPPSPDPSPTPGLIMVARSPVSSAGAPGSWLKFYHGSFVNDALANTPGTPIVAASPLSGCTPPERQAGITYNDFLGLYLLTMTCDQGWYFSTSSDLVTWSEPVQFYQAPFPNNTLADGQEFDWYPTLYSPGAKSPATTHRTGYVYYTKGNYNSSPHIMYRRSFTIAK